MSSTESSVTIRTQPARSQGLAVAARELARAQLLARRARLLGLNLVYDYDDGYYYDGVDD